MKKFIVLGLVLAAAVAMFIACGGGGSSSHTGTVRIVGDSN